MLVEDKRFRIFMNGEWGFKLTRYELLKKLKKSAIDRSWNWPYSIKYGEERKVKNVFGKILIVRKEYTYSEELARKEHHQEIPY